MPPHQGSRNPLRPTANVRPNHLTMFVDNVSIAAKVSFDNLLCVGVSVMPTASSRAAVPLKSKACENVMLPESERGAIFVSIIAGLSVSTTERGNLAAIPRAPVKVSVTGIRRALAPETLVMTGTSVNPATPIVAVIE